MFGLSDKMLKSLGILEAFEANDRYTLQMRFFLLLLLLPQVILVAFQLYLGN